MLWSMRTVFSAWCGWTLGMCCWVFAGSWASAEIEAAGQISVPQETTVVTNLLQIRQMDFSNLGISYPVRLNVEGLVCWASPAQKPIRPAGRIEWPWSWNSKGIIRSLKAGQRVRLSGTGWLSKRGSRFVMVSDLVVENDGLHQLTEKSGATFLKAGGPPFGSSGSTEWAILDWQWHAKAGAAAPQVERCGSLPAAKGRPRLGERTGLPVLRRIVECPSEFQPTETGPIGICSNLDLSVRSRNENVVFSSADFFEVPRDGVYTFYLRSDDGSRPLSG